MIQTNGIDHLVLHVSDVARAKKFYTELLGMTAYRENEEQAFLHCGQQGVALFKKRGDAALTTGNDLNHLALNVESGTYETLKSELERHGVAVSGRGKLARSPPGPGARRGSAGCRRARP